MITEKGSAAAGWPCVGWSFSCSFFVSFYQLLLNSPANSSGLGLYIRAVDARCENRALWLRAQLKELQWISQLCAWLCWGLPSALVQLGVTVCKSLVWVHAFEPMLQGAVRTAWAVGLCQVPTRWWEWLLKLSPPCSHIQVSSSWDSDCNYHNKQICFPLVGPCPHECGTACASQGT